RHHTRKHPTTTPASTPPPFRTPPLRSGILICLIRRNEKDQQVTRLHLLRHTHRRINTPIRRRSRHTNQLRTHQITRIDWFGLFVGPKYQHHRYPTPAGRICLRSQWTKRSSTRRSRRK